MLINLFLFRKANLSKVQLRYFYFWFTAVLGGEFIMIIFNSKLPQIYLLIAIAFGVGLVLRLLRIYPGKPEPTILDLSAVVLSLGFSCLAKVLGVSKFRFLLIFISSIIVLPHLIYILLNEDKL